MLQLIWAIIVGMIILGLIELVSQHNLLRRIEKSEEYQKWLTKQENDKIQY